MSFFMFSLNRPLRKKTVPDISVKFSPSNRTEHTVRIFPPIPTFPTPAAPPPSSNGNLQMSNNKDQTVCLLF